MIQIEASQLNLQAKLGDQIELSFNRIASGKFLAEERINGHVCFLDRESERIRSGDRCLARLKNRCPKGEVYYASVLWILEAGDGKNTLLKRVMELSRPTFVKCPYYVRAGMKKARAYFKHRHLDLLRFHFRYIERLKLEQTLCSAQIEYAPVALETIDLIERCSSHNSAEAVVYLVALANLLSTGRSESELVSEIFVRARKLAELKATSKIDFVSENFSRLREGSSALDL